MAKGDYGMTKGRFTGSLRHLKAAAAMTAVLLGPAMAARGQEIAAPITPAVATQQDAVSILVSAIRHELEPLPCSAPPEDLEAAIVYSLSQANVRPDAVRGALREIEMARSCHISEGKAIGRIRVALLSRGYARGTAAVGGEGFIGTGSMFSDPTIVIGGGSVNYSD